VQNDYIIWLYVLLIPSLSSLYTISISNLEFNSILIFFPVQLLLKELLIKKIAYL